MVDQAINDWIYLLSQYYASIVRIVSFEYFLGVRMMHVTTFFISLFVLKVFKNYIMDTMLGLI